LNVSNFSVVITNRALENHLLNLGKRDELKRAKKNAEKIRKMFGKD